MDQSVEELSAAEFAGPDLASAASIIRHYGERNSLTPAELLGVFNSGLCAAIRRDPRPAWLPVGVVVSPAPV